MIWINHKISSFSLVFLFTHDIVSSLIAAGGSVVPDAVEGHDHYSDRWRKNHRRFGHWLLGYVIIAFLLWTIVRFKTKISILSLSFAKFISVFPTFNSETLIYVFLFVCFYISIGCILHVLQDALSSSVPLIHPTRRTFSIGIMRIGSPAEYILSFGLLVGAILWK